MAKDTDEAKAKKAGLEFHVVAHGMTHIYNDARQACALAVALSMSDGLPHEIDVVCWSREAAVLHSGDEGGEQYDEDPEASVFERITISAQSLGRIA